MRMRIKCYARGAPDRLLVLVLQLTPEIGDNNWGHELYVDPVMASNIMHAAAKVLYLLD